MAAVVLGLALAAAAADAQQSAPPRQIAPDRFAPMPRDAATIDAPRATAPAPRATPPLPAHAPIVMPTRERPLGACDRNAIDWLNCLGATAKLSDSAVGETETRLVGSLDRRPRLNPVLREAIANALKGADEAWRTLRERECSDLALIENGLTGIYFEARLVCRIRRNLERVEALSARYGEQP